jgi:uncharacterized caspase-like protein
MAFDQGHALLVGVGTYAHIPAANVPITVADATAVRHTLGNPSFCGYPDAQVKMLHDTGATRANILAALDELRGKTKPTHTVTLFYCGHGQYGTDGNYYLTTHDTELKDHKVKAGTGISEADLLEQLRAIPVQRLLLIINACHSGEISPNLDMGAPPAPLDGTAVPEEVTGALLSSGEGRIIITASRPEQKSWIGSGPLTIFTQALVEGLQGKGFVLNNAGYISAFSLYEHVHTRVKKAAALLGRTQEPELTVLRGVGPFAVSLYRGATDLGDFTGEQGAPPDTAVREVDPEDSARFAGKSANVVTVTGKGAVGIGGDAKNNIIVTGNRNRINR